MDKISIVFILVAIVVACGKASGTELTFLSRTYRLGAFNQRENATWEYVTGSETIENWTTLLTLVDRPDVQTAEEMDLLAEGIMTTYRSHGGQVLLAKAMRDKFGAPYNYLVAAFEEPAERRFELNFVKIAMGEKNAYIVIYDTRIADLEDYKTKGKDFLDQHSAEIGCEMENTAPPDWSTLPRQAF